MIIYIFDLDDCLIKHRFNKEINYNNIKKNEILNDLLNHCKCHEKYIFTNGTKDHANLILNNMNIINNFNNIFSRNDMKPFMKPNIESYLYVLNNINRSSNFNNHHNYYFFDDQLENLRISKNFNWVTIWIHYNFLNKPEYVDYSFPNIYQALLCLNFFSSN